ncbi:MerR family transcriptional regulator [Defluviitalea phaphyphila]|uniref:hypothetical protein n=1 Tax=Defluviitalea phaphyphila TaxID=1473580 RepID=UPI0007313DEA|nr:hypothetical protein [Defluviitalea phaphyphila]
MSKKVRFIGIQEASDITGLSLTTLRRGVESGRFLAIKSGGDKGRYLFDEALLLKTLQDEALSRVKNDERRSYLASLFKDDDEADDSKPQSATITI